MGKGYLQFSWGQFPDVEFLGQKVWRFLQILTHHETYFQMVVTLYIIPLAIYAFTNCTLLACMGVVVNLMGGSW